VADQNVTAGVSRRALLTAVLAGGATLAGSELAAAQDADAGDDTVKLVRQLTGKVPSESPRVHLTMPRVFPNGYIVPLTLDIDTAMSETDHVSEVRVLAPRNPIIDIATFRFAPGRSQPRVSTRIRLAEPQFVLAVAEMNGGALLMTKAWVEVATNGCS